VNVTERNEITISKILPAGRYKRTSVGIGSHHNRSNWWHQKYSRLPSLHERRSDNDASHSNWKFIAELKEVAEQLIKGLHFPFKIQLENWCKIQKYVKINAYYDRPDIYTIFRFPIIAYPTYRIIKTLSIYDYKNIFTFLKINHPLLAIDKENHNYMLPDRDDLQACVQDATTYTCDRNLPLLRGIGCTLRGANIHENAGTDPQLRKGANIIRHYVVDNVDRRAIVALFNTTSARSHNKVRKWKRG